LDGEHVQGRLRRAIADDPEGVEFRGRVAEIGERAEAARKVDYPTRSRPLQQRQHRLDDSERAEEIGLERAANRVEIGRTGRSIAGAGDARVVHQDVEPPLVGVDIGRGGGDRGRVGQIDLHKARRDAFAAERPDRRRATVRVARADQDTDSVPAELAGDLEADALVGAGDEGDAVVRITHGDLSSCNRRGSEAQTASRRKQAASWSLTIPTACIQA
jgi:hypothetical protein